MSDDVVWNCIRHNHCSFMAKIETGIFCRNPYNVTGICNRSSCPLANSRYATIRDHDGVFYLCMKTVERAHLPKNLWERVKLPRNYEMAIEVINKHLEFWPKLLVHKIKQRLTKMTQYRIRMRKLQLKVREKIVTVPRKKALRDFRREDFALRAAKIDNCVQRELLERLKNGCYLDIYNHDYEEFIALLNQDGEIIDEIGDKEEDNEEEYVIADDMETEMDDMEDFGGRLNGLGGINEDDLLLAELAVKKQKRSSSSAGSMVGKRSKKVITELEQDEDMQSRQRTLA